MQIYIHLRNTYRPYKTVFTKGVGWLSALEEAQVFGVAREEVMEPSRSVFHLAL